MDKILQQVGELLLAAIPTMVLLLLTYWIYNVVLRKPLVKVLAERSSRTEGAVQKARTDVAIAEARTQEYEQKLREARLALFKSLEARRATAQQARAEAVAQARSQAQEQVRQARAGIEKDMAEARTGLQGEVERLAGEIIRTVLRPAGSAPVAGGQA
jgi:F-type H+-transporting ATPase subunit b